MYCTAATLLYHWTNIRKWLIKLATRLVREAFFKSSLLTKQLFRSDRFSFSFQNTSQFVRRIIRHLDWLLSGTSPLLPNVLAATYRAQPDVNGVNLTPPQSGPDNCCLLWQWCCHIERHHKNTPRPPEHDKNLYSGEIGHAGRVLTQFVYLLVWQPDAVYHRDIVWTGKMLDVSSWNEKKCPAE